MLGTCTGVWVMESPQKSWGTVCTLPPSTNTPHLRICIWKAKVFVLGRSWAGLPRLLSSSEAVRSEIGDLVREEHPGSPVPTTTTISQALPKHYKNGPLSSRAL